MIFSELKERFKNGETVKLYFGTRKTLYSIGDDRITHLQFQKLLKELPREKVDFKGDWQVITKHYYTYKTNN
jgi:hypothetical protein